MSGQRLPSIEDNGWQDRRAGGDFRYVDTAGGCQAWGTAAAKPAGQGLPDLPDRGYRTCRKKQPIYKPYYTHRT